MNLRLKKLLLITLVAFSLPSFGQDPSDSSIAYVTPEVTEKTLFEFTPPEGFKYDSLRSIYLNMNIGAGIQIMQLENTNPVTMYKAVDEEFFRTNNLTLISKDTVKTTTGLLAYLIKSQFKTNNLDYIRYSIICGDLNNSCWMHFTYPKDADVILEDYIKKSVLSIKATTNEIKE